jgi:hypothetical protein
MHVAPLRPRRVYICMYTKKKREEETGTPTVPPGTPPKSHHIRYKLACEFQTRALDGVVGSDRPKASFGKHEIRQYVVRIRVYNRFWLPPAPR